ncbi:MAG: response regulator transcription factor, partial [Methyloprofundus sp.]|nr:response regulator transcription factor [Methyloprofundus sp.]
LDAGAKGFISKNSAANILIEAIQCIKQGQTYVEQGLKSRSLLAPSEAVQTDHQLIIKAFTPREFDVFLLLAKGHTSHKIAEQLCIGYKTVANYSTQIKKKLNVSNVAELAHIAVLYGMVNH